MHTPRRPEESKQSHQSLTFQKVKHARFPRELKLAQPAAPTNEMAKGTKINVFATTPHLTESAKTAISKPNIIQREGTKISHIKLFLIASLNCI